MKASPEDQALLLELQALDTRLQQLDHRMKTLPEHAELEELATTADEQRQVHLADLGTLEDARAELARIEGDVEVVEARIARDTERLNTSSSVKDVQGLESELASLRKRQSDLEDMQLAVMERIDELEAAEAASRGLLDDVNARIGELTTTRDSALATIDAERGRVAAERAALTGRIPADLLALYERQRERYGAGASHLQGGVSLAAGVRLNESDLDEVRRSAPDDVVMCPISSAILVRTSESGL